MYQWMSKQMGYGEEDGKKSNKTLEVPDDDEDAMSSGSASPATHSPLHKDRRSTHTKKKDQKSASDDEDEDFPSGAEDSGGEASDDDSRSKPAVVCPFPVHNLDWGGWSEADHEPIILRGANYAKDSKKIPASRAVFSLDHVDVFATPDKIFHMSARDNSYAIKRYNAILKERQDAGKISKDKPNPSIIQSTEDRLSPAFIVNFLVPLGAGKNCNLVLYFIRRGPTYKNNGALSSSTSSSNVNSSNNNNNNNVNNNTNNTEKRASVTSRTASASVSDKKSAEMKDRDSDPDVKLKAFDRMLVQFLKGSDEFRNARFKVIPRVVDGGWFVKKVVGGKPALMGQKITQHYFYDEVRNYFELAVDLGSSRIAGKILSVVNAQAAKLIVDVLFILQGDAEDELPESVLGGTRLIHMRLDKFKSIDELGL